LVSAGLLFDDLLLAGPVFFDVATTVTFSILAPNLKPAA